MKKIIKNWGQGLGIYFNQDDIKIYNIKEGQTIDLELTILKNKKNGKKHKLEKIIKEVN